MLCIGRLHPSEIAAADDTHRHHQHREEQERQIIQHTNSKVQSVAVGPHSIPRHTYAPLTRFFTPATCARFAALLSVPFTSSSSAPFTLSTSSVPSSTSSCPVM